MADFKDMLANRSLKATPQRMAVHAALQELVHADADAVCRHIAAGSGVKVSKASVYNTLTQMADLGIYGRRMSADGKMHFDFDPARHLHLYDKTCHEFINVKDKGLVEAVEMFLKGRKFKGYRIESWDLQIICRPTGKGKKAR